MTFLNPLVLLGLAAAAIPLIIHLFNFRRPRRVDFSSLAFVKELQKSTMRRMRLQQLLLLILRTLVIFFLVLAFARPTIHGDWATLLGERAQTSVAIVIDNSLSMTLRDGGGEYLAQARDLAADIVEQMSAGDEVFVIATSAAQSGTGTPFVHRGPALDRLRELRAGPASRSISEAIMEAGAALEDAGNLNKEVYVISDFQRSLLDEHVLRELPQGLRVTLLPVGDRAYSNIAVTDVEIASRIVEAGQPVNLEATIVNFGGEPVSGYIASVFLEEDRVAQTSVDLAPGVSTRVRFTVTPQRRGWLAGRVEVEEDAFDFDNRRSFVLHVPETRNLLLVQGDGQDVRHLRLALSPELTRGRTVFSVNTISGNALAGANLSAYDGVILAGPRTLSSGEIASLSRFVEGGGGVLFFPSERASAEDYNAFFRSVQAGTFTGFSGSMGQREVIATLDRADLDHPLFEGMFDARPGSEEHAVEQADVYHAMNYRPGGGREQTLLHLSGGLPLLSEVRYGEGTMLVSSVAPDRRWSDLPVRGLFVPLMYRAMYHLSSPGSAADEQLTVGSRADVRVSGVRQADFVRITGPDGEEFIPEQRSVYGAVLVETPPAIANPGVYDIRAGDRILRRIAFNYDSRESDLRAADPQEVVQIIEQRAGAQANLIDPRRNEGAASLSEAIYEGRYGAELWRVFLLFALVCLVAEMVVGMQRKTASVATAST